MPGSLEDALDALERDHAFLLKGDVFTEELLRTYVDYKRHERGRRHSATPASLRVRALLRHLSDPPEAHDWCDYESKNSNS